MKKNKRTAATAAMFATALNMALGSVAIPNGSQPLNAKADEPEYTLPWKFRKMFTVLPNFLK